MKTMLIPILTVAATCTAFADLERKDSSEFDYKYEMVERPDQQDLDNSGANDFTGWGTAFTLGTGADVGSIKIDASSNGKYLLSNQDVGTAGDGWHSMAPSSSTGFTVEARVKVTACTGNNGAICIEAGPSDSKVYARLNLFDGKIGWNGTVLKTMDTKSDFHTYRITREGGKAVHSVYVDGVLVAENLGTGFTYNTSTLYRMLLGSPGSGWTGKAEVAWLRFHKGAYAPVDEKAVEKANRLDSTKFDVKYEMTATDNIPTSTSTSDWTINGASGATIVKNGGVLSVTPNSKQPYWLSTDATWKNNILAGTAFTVEFAVQPKSCTISNADRTMQFVAGIPNATSVLNVGTNHVYWQATDSNDSNILLDSSDNSDKMHKFRIAYDGKSTHGFTVWRDDVKIGEALVGNQKWNSLHYVRFGIPGKTVGGAFDVDYIRWKIGGVYTPDTRKGLMVLVK